MDEELQQFIELVRSEAAEEKIDLAINLHQSNKAVCEYTLLINRNGQCSECNSSFIPSPKSIKPNSKKDYTRNYRCKCTNSVFSVFTGTRLERSPIAPIDWIDMLSMKDKSFQSIKRNFHVANDTASSLTDRLRPHDYKVWKQCCDDKKQLKEKSESAKSELYKIIREIERYVEAENLLLDCKAFLKANDSLSI